MNKNIIAIAIATAMAAPVAMADVKVSGRVGGHLVNTDTDGAGTSMGFDDKGQTRLQFDGSAGEAYARIALDERLARDQADYNQVFRDQYIGYKLGGGASFQFGRMGTAGKNIEKDPYIGTFLEVRSSVGNPATNSRYASSSFVDHIIQGKMKAGAATITAQYDVGDSSKYSPNEGHLALAVTGKGGPVKYWFAYNNGSAEGPGQAPTPGNDDSNMKLGASMKFGKVKASLNYVAADNDGASQTAITLGANMGLGNGLSVNAGLAIRSGDTVADDATWIRIAVAKKLNKNATAYAGYTTTDYDTGGGADFSKIGAGMTVKF